ALHDEGLDVLGHRLMDREAIRPDPQGRPDRDHAGEGIAFQPEQLAILPDEAHQFVGVALKGLEVAPAIRKACFGAFPDVRLCPASPRAGRDAVTRECPPQYVSIAVAT